MLFRSTHDRVDCLQSFTGEIRVTKKGGDAMTIYEILSVSIAGAGLLIELAKGVVFIISCLKKDSDKEKTRSVHQQNGNVSPKGK